MQWRDCTAEPLAWIPPRELLLTPALLLHSTLYITSSIAADHRPWQLPGAAHIFPRQGLSVIPLAAETFLAAEDRSGIALCETAGSLTYQLWGRL
jgi:hypothetical protein